MLISSLILLHLELKETKDPRKLPFAPENKGSLNEVNNPRPENIEKPEGDCQTII